jgi:hypothetical protein
MIVARHLMQGEPLYILFDEDGESVFDSQNRPRMYKSVEGFEKAFRRGLNGTHLEKYVPQKQWISVNDRLPEDGQSVLVHYVDGWMPVAHLLNGKWYQSGGETSWLSVTHWMPLPEPPKEE